MDTATLATVLGFCEPLFKYLKRGYLFVRSFITARAELAVAQTKIAELESKMDELKRENESQRTNLSALRLTFDRHRRYRRILFGGCAVYELRPEFVGEGDPPLFLCPSCFTRGIDSELVARPQKDKAGLRYERRTHLKCLTPGCKFEAVYLPEVFKQLFKAAQRRAAGGPNLVQTPVAADAAQATQNLG